MVSRRNEWIGFGLLFAGGAAALWLFVLLGYFFLTDGRTIGGDKFRGDPEFQRYWLVNGAALLAASGCAWMGKSLSGSGRK